MLTGINVAFQLRPCYVGTLRLRAHGRMPNSPNSECNEGHFPQRDHAVNFAQNHPAP